MGDETEIQRRNGARSRAPSFSDAAKARFDASVSKASVILREAERVEVLARCAAIEAYFRLGDEVHDVRVAGGCGTRAVGVLAKKLGVDESRLQKIGRMAERIRGEERSAICRLTDSAGLPLAPSLVVELGRLHRADDRLRLARAAVDEQLSVRLLRARIDVTLTEASRNAPVQTRVVK